MVSGMTFAVHKTDLSHPFPISSWEPLVDGGQAKGACAPPPPEFLVGFTRVLLNLKIRSKT